MHLEVRQLIDKVSPSLPSQLGKDRRYRNALHSMTVRADLQSNGLSGDSRVIDGPRPIHVVTARPCKQHPKGDDLRHLVHVTHLLTATFPLSESTSFHMKTEENVTNTRPINRRTACSCPIRFAQSRRNWIGTQGICG